MNGKLQKSLFNLNHRDYMKEKLALILSLLTIGLLVTPCTLGGSHEMEEMTRDVLKSKEGVEIDVKPLYIPGQR